VPLLFLLIAWLSTIYYHRVGILEDFVA